MDNNIEYLKFHFEDSYEKCLLHDDDRRLFVNWINILTDACLDMKQVENNTIKVAFNRYFETRLSEIKTLEQSLKQRNMI